MSIGFLQKSKQKEASVCDYFEQNPSTGALSLALEEPVVPDYKSSLERFKLQASCFTSI